MAPRAAVRRLLFTTLMKTLARAARLVTLVAIAAAVAVSFAASRAWSDAGGAQRETDALCPAVGCVASSDGSFCLCKSGVDVCAGERAVESCSAPRAETCCVSAGTCYCARDAKCADGDVPTDRCHAKMIASGPRCEIGGSAK